MKHRRKLESFLGPKVMLFKRSIKMLTAVNTTLAKLSEKHFLELLSKLAV